MLKFKFLIRYRGSIISVFEDGNTMVEAFDKVTSRYTDATFLASFHMVPRSKK